MKNLIPKILFVLSLLFSKGSYSQIYVLKNEVSIFSFNTTTGKHMELARDKNNIYIVYRFGTKNKIEFEYPQKDTSSWKKFSYTSALRGGGIANEGVDLNYVYFINNSFQYVIYDTYFARGNKTATGIKIFDLKTNSLINIKAIKRSTKGTLTDLRDITLINDGDEFFD